MLKVAETPTALPPMPDLTSQQWKQLEKGDMVKRHEKYTDSDGHSAGRGVAYIIANKPHTSVWEQLMKFDRYHEFYPMVKKCEVYKEQGNEIWVQFNIKVPLMKIRYHIWHEFFPEESRLIWEMDQSKENAYKNTTGHWIVWPMENGKSLLGYTAELESGKPIPKFIEDMIADQGLAKVMESIKKRVESGGKYKR